MANQYTTQQIAKALGISPRHLYRLLADGTIQEPKQRVTLGGMDYRVWTQADLKRAKQIISKRKPEPKPKKRSR